MIRTQISMTEEQADALRRLAALRRVSQAALLRDALDELLGNEVRLRRIERARAACGAFRSDLGPVSGADHDALLDDAFAS
jgi:hypothetical protein